MSDKENNNSRVDLHLHSTYSDGYLTPVELINKAHDVGLCAISITDHDNVNGIEEAIVQGNRIGIEVIPGVELSTTERGSDTHILGYFIDKENQSLAEHLEFFCQHRIKRAKQIVEKLRKLGCNLSFDDIISRSKSGSIGRPHIAEAMVESNFVISLNEAFWRYLGDNKSAFVPKYRISTIDAIIMVKKAGGLSFLAHPGSDTPEKLIIDFIKHGLCGIEVIHPRHSKKEIAYFRELIKEYNILECGGSDYHSDIGNQASIGEYILPYDIVAKMKARL